MTRRQVIGALALAVSITASIASMLVRSPADAYPSEAMRWSKVAAEKLEIGHSTKDPRVLFSALGAVDRALRSDPAFVDAHFQRGIILENLGLSSASARAFAEYLKLDSSSKRAVDALRRMRTQRARWKTRPSEDWWLERRTIRGAALAGDTAMVTRITHRFPADAYHYAEAEGLRKWAYGVLTQRTDNATSSLMVARAIGNALTATAGEQMIADAVNEIDTALETGDRKRIRLLARAHDMYATRPPVAGMADGVKHTEAVAAIFNSTLSYCRTYWYNAT